MIGNGNVAADVARMLALTHERARETDTADHAIEALADAGVEEIVVLGRRGPAQAAFTNPEVRELGEMADADIVIDPAEIELDEAQPRVPRVRRRRSDQPPQRRDLHRVLAARARGQAEADRDALPAARRSRSRATARSSAIVIGRNELYARRVRPDPRPRHRRARGDRVRPGAALDRLQGHPDSRAFPFDDAPRPDPQRGRPGHRSRDRRAGPRPLRGRLDQARPLRRDRHEQEGRAGDRRHPLRRPRDGRVRASGSGARPERRGLAEPRTWRRSRRCSTSAAATTSPSWAGRRSTPPRSAGRQAARPPAGQVLPRRTRWSRRRDRAWQS